MRYDEEYPKDTTVTFGNLKTKNKIIDSNHPLQKYFNLNHEAEFSCKIFQPHYKNDEMNNLWNKTIYQSINLYFPVSNSKMIGMCQCCTVRNEKIHSGCKSENRIHFQPGHNITRKIQCNRKLISECGSRLLYQHTILILIHSTVWMSNMLHVSPDSVPRLWRTLFVTNKESRRVCLVLSQLMLHSI